MTELETKLTAIKTEKDTKIIPGNIKKDVTIFDITGTLEEGTILDVDDETAYVSGTTLLFEDWDGSSITITDPSTQVYPAPYGYVSGSSGSVTQAKTYYDTGVKADQDTEVIIQYSGMGKSYDIDGTLSTELCQLFGFRYRSGSTNSRQFGFSDFNGGCFSFGNQEVNISDTGYTLCENDYTTTRTLRLNKNGIYIYNNSTMSYDLVKALDYDGTQFETESTLTLFGRNTYYTSTNRYSLDGRGYMRIYSMQVYKNGVLTNHFQPEILTFIPQTFTYRPVGFYDVVTHKFLLPKTYTPYDLR